jgi:hypothetical protein
VRARWWLADGTALTILANLGERDCRLSHEASAAPLFESRPGLAQSLANVLLPGYSTIVFIDPAS